MENSHQRKDIFNMKARKIKKLVKEFKESGLHNTFRLVTNYLIYHYYRLCPSNKKIVLRNVQNYKMYLDVTDPGVSKSLFKRGIREKLLTIVVKNELNEGDVVLDIGANLGYYALIEAGIVGNMGKVYAIEPNPKNFKILKKNIAVNNLPKIIEPLELAISNKKGTSRLFLTKFSNHHTMAKIESNKYVGSINVKTCTIDYLLKKKRKVDLIRMDIEGYECEAIDGAIKTLSKAKHPIKLIIEIHNRYYNEKRNIKPRLKKLIKLGFTVKYILSAKEAVPKEFSKLGYKPITAVKADCYRGLYKNIPTKEAIKLICHKPQIVRYIVLEKKSKQK